MTREIGPVRKGFSGDEELAQTYTGLARTILGQLKEQMQSLKLQVLSRTVNLSDGTVIYVASIFGQDVVRVDAPSILVAQPQEEFRTPELARPVEYAFFFFTTTAAPGPLSTELFGGALTLGVQDGALAVVPEVRDIEQRLQAISRALARREFALAENLIRFITGVEQDSALNCDDGFFVDPVFFAGLPYEARLTAITAPYRYAFNHAGIPAETGGTYPPEYLIGRAFSGGNFAESVGFHHTFYYFNSSGSKIAMPKTMLRSEGTALISGDECMSVGPGYDAPPIGTEITHSRLFLQSTDHLLVSNTHESDVIHYTARMEIQRTYVVYLNDVPGTVMRANLLTAPGGFNCPNTGTITNTAVRVKHRRTPSGWVEYSRTTVSLGNSVLSIAGDGNDPPAYAVGGAATVHAKFEALSGTTAYADWTFGSSAARYTSSMKGLDSVFTRPPSGPAPFSPLFGLGQRILYNDQTSAATGVLAGADFVTQGCDAAGSQFQKTRAGVLRVRGVAGSFDIAPNLASAYALGAGDLPQLFQATTWTQPRSAATEAAFYNTTVLSATMDSYELVGKYNSTIVPPSNFEAVCVRQVSSGKFLYVQLRDPGGADAFRTARFSYLLALIGEGSAFGTGTINERRQAMLDLVTIPVNTGLPADFAVFANLGAIGATVIL